jgi:hypothetical protein
MAIGIGEFSELDSIYNGHVEPGIDCSCFRQTMTQLTILLSSSPILICRQTQAYNHGNAGHYTPLLDTLTGTHPNNPPSGPNNKNKKTCNLLPHLRSAISFPPPMRTIQHRCPGCCGGRRVACQRYLLSARGPVASATAGTASPTVRTAVAAAFGRTTNPVPRGTIMNTGEVGEWGVGGVGILECSEF